MARAIHPFEQLKQLAQRVKDHAAPLPEKSSKDNTWQAIAFRLNEATMLIDMNAVSEVSPQPPVTSTPSGVAPMCHLWRERTVKPVFKLAGTPPYPSPWARRSR